MVDFNDENNPRPRREVVIEDMRHRRNVDDVDELQEEADTAPPAAPPEPQHLDVVREELPEPAEEPERIEIPTAADAAGPDARPADGGAQGHPSLSDPGNGEAAYSEDEIRAMEREQLRQIIGMGVVNYLKYQLTMVLNFALLNLGSAADPSTGLVTKNLPAAKLAIDVLEFLVARLQSEMNADERTQLAQLVSDLKYNFMQAAAGGDAPVASNGETGEA